MFAWLTLDDNFRKEALDRYGRLISGGRLEHVGAISLAVLVLLGGLYSYLRLTPAKASIASGAMQSASFDSRPAANGPIDTVAAASPVAATSATAQPARRMHWAFRLVLTVLIGGMVVWFLLAAFWAFGMRATIS
jgi:hypothetical protein